ncbi:DUF421 domain-containing protein [Blastococcus brunescens]|uniref:YetF domain-containing protein n=1 Tax=Blastococcus brunescens TaxID=1564165 RepID=A0ABZ1B6L9_9ACTN|nr:YetF domain-containing protein [Blastococcus sp. BMG 8361]WRL66017.1 YetF domain-containing protein [Blastococcus sp. BMG 8361]
MDAVLRALAIYLILMLLFRLSGKRTLGQVTTFDFVLLLVVGEATQQALLGEDFSITQAAVVIATLIGLDRASDYFSWRFGPFKRVTESVPVVLVNKGKLLHDVLRREHISEDDIMSSARATQGLENLDQVKYAIMETSGGISIVPTDEARRGS